MQKRKLGRTGLEVSVLSFGCGAVGGLMTKGDTRDQERAFARALEAGITYFDTAAQYGDGASETNLGRILSGLTPNVQVGTKVRLKEDEYGRIGAAIEAALDASLKRLGRDSVDLYQLHNRIGAATAGDMLEIGRVLGDVVPAFERLRAKGKIRHFGITALGETPALHAAVASRAFDTAQICFNALNASADAPVPAGYPGQNYDALMTRAHTAGMGTIGIRVLAGGALSGSVERHPLNMQSVDPIGSGASFADDAARARTLAPLLADGIADSLPELALRFAISSPSLSTTLIGLATMAQLETAIAAASKGPLPREALERIKAVQAGFAGT